MSAQDWQRTLAEDVERGWSERGLPAELLARARSARVPDRQLQNMMTWNATIERIEQEIGWTERLLEGSLRFRQVTPLDNEAFCELWANSPEQIGDWDMTVERGPDGFAQFELQERPALNALFDCGVMVACVGFSIRMSVVAGKRIAIHYGQAMRVHQEHRRHGYANWVRSLPWAIGIIRPTQVQYDFIRGRNMEMERWNRKNMPEVQSVPKREDDVPGLPVTVLEYAARAGGSSSGVRKARADDVEQCAALINRTHSGLDLFRPYTTGRLGDRLDEGYTGRDGHPWAAPYGLGDFYVLERNGRIDACAGLWDRGRDVREHWRHRETGQERSVSYTNLLDFGCAEGAEEALAALIDALIARTYELGRDALVAPLESLPEVASSLSSYEPTPETRYLQWRADTPPFTVPAYLDLVYW